MFEERVSAIYRELVPEFLADVNRLNQQTSVFQVHNLGQGGYASRLNHGYASVIETFGLLHGHQITPRAKNTLSQMAAMLHRNSEDDAQYRPLMGGVNSPNMHDRQYALDIAKKHAAEKTSELYSQGQTLIISGNAGHATIVRLSLDRQGDIVCSTYNAGEEGWPIPGKRNVLAVERHQKLRDPAQLEDLIVNHALKSASAQDSPQHKQCLSEIENCLERPYTWREGNGQSWGNCTARSPREFIIGMCIEAGQPELADGIRELSVGGIEDLSFDPHQLQRSLSGALDRVRDMSHEQFIRSVIEQNGGLVTGFRPDGTREQIKDSFHVTEYNNWVSLDIYPPASSGTATALENKLRATLGKNADNLIERHGDTLTWDASISDVVAGSIQAYIGEKSMDSLRAKTYQKQYGRGDDFTIRWDNDRMFATDRRDGICRTYTRAELDGHLLKDNPKAFMERLVPEGANFQDKGDSRGMYFNAMQKLRMNGIQRTIVEAMKYHGYFAERPNDNGLPNSVGITNKNPRLKALANDCQLQHRWERAKAAHPDLARLSELNQREARDHCGVLPVVLPRQVIPSVNHTPARTAHDREDPNPDHCRTFRIPDFGKTAPRIPTPEGPAGGRGR